jgi:HK97 family phage major capsid protein
MSEYTKELKAERHQKVTRMAAIVGNGKRSLTAAEREEFDDLDYEVKGIDSRVANAKTDFIGMDGQKQHRTEADNGFTRYLRSGRTEYRADGTGLSTAPNDVGTAAGPTGPTAGYLIPQGFWANLQVAMKQFGGTSNDFKYVQTDTGNPTPWPSTDPTTVTGQWLTGENNQLAVTEPYTFGQGMLAAWTLAVGPFLASLQLVEDSAFDVDNFVAERIGEAMGRSIAQIAISGTGATQPLGIITALAAKSSATGTVGTGTITASGGYVNLATASTVKTLSGSNPTELSGNILSPSTLLAMIQSVDPAYRNDPDGNPTSAFYVNDAHLAGLRNLVDNYGRPLLILPNQGGAPTLWGYPVKVDNNIPSLAASTVGGPIFGNLQNAMVQRVVRSDARIVANVNPAGVMRLTERYADYLAIGYLGYIRLDIRSNDLRAAVTVKPAGT